MKKFTIYLSLFFTFLCLNTAIFGQVSITGTTPVTQNFDSLTTANFNLTDNTSITGVYALRASGNATPNVATADTGSSNAGGFKNYGTSAATDRALGSAGANSTGTLNYGVRYKNDTGSTITALTVSYTGEQWRNGGNATAQTLSFDYRQAATVTDLTGTYTAVPALNFTTLINTTTAAALDGNATANRTSLSQTIMVSIPAGEEIMLRWTDLNDTGNDHGVSIDDLSVTATVATASIIDLTISRDTFDTTISPDGTVTYDVTIANGGMDAANNVKANFVIPNGLTYSSTNTNCGFTPTLSGSTLSLTGGTVSDGGSCALQIIGTATGGGYIIDSLPTDVTVDPDGTITETDETNNNASGNAVTTVFFPSTIVGLYGRTSLAQLMNDLLEIPGAQLVILDQNLTETSNVTVPDGITLDFENFTVSGNIIFTFGTEGGAGFRTVNVNGLGDATHPGSLQVTQVNFVGATDVEYYQFSQTLGKLGEIRPTAYNHPQVVYDFRINNPAGLNIVAPFTVEGDFFLTNGIIYNGTNNITLSELTRNNGENGSGGTETSFVAGPLTKILPSFLLNKNLGLPTDYIFPVGTVDGVDNGYSPLRAANFTTGSPNSGLTVQAFDTNAPGILTPSLSRYWQITEIGDVTTDLQFNWRSGEDSAITNQVLATIVRNGVVACNGNCTFNFGALNASITGVSEFSPWTVAENAVTAASSSISGRVLNSNGFAQNRAKVLVTDQSGQTVTATTNNFGNYTVDGLRAGETYIVNVIAKQAQYATRIVTLNEDATNIDFTPQD